MATNFSRVIKAFIFTPAGPAAFYDDLSNFTQMFGSTLYVLQTLIGDAMVVRTVSILVLQP